MRRKSTLGVSTGLTRTKQGRVGREAGRLRRARRCRALGKSNGKQEYISTLEGHSL